MQLTQKVPIALVALLFVVAAVAELATGRSGNPQDDQDGSGRTALITMDDALARGDSVAALRAWQQASETARMNRGWRDLVEVADARVRIEAATNGAIAAAPAARQAYLAALSRARAERSVDGTVRVAEGFSQLGDRDVAEQVLRIASSLAAQSRDRAAPMRVETARVRLLEQSSSPARATF